MLLEVIGSSVVVSCPFFFIVLLDAIKKWQSRRKHKRMYIKKACRFYQKFNSDIMSELERKSSCISFK